MTDLERIEKKIHSLRKELERWEAAALCVRELRHQDDDSDDSVNGEADERRLTGQTVKLCAKIILKENRNRPMHYQKIADLAMERGYSSGRETDDPVKSTRTSFWSLLKRAPKIFEPMGNGTFRRRVDAEDQ